jgi:hypothetical protein
MRLAKKLFATLSAIMAIALGGIANADIFFQDNFDNNGALLGLSPNVGGVWTITGTSVVNPLTVTGNSLGILTTGQDAWGALTGVVPATAGNSLFTGVDINVSAAQATGDYFLHLSDPAGTTTNFYQRLFVRSSGAGFQLGLQSNSGTGTLITYGSTVLNLGQNYRVVTSWDFVSGLANDVFNIYVDPTDATPGNNTPYLAGYTWTGNAEPLQLAAANFRQGTAANAPTLLADRLVVSNVFADAALLTVIPEPAAGFALIALAGMAGLARRRRS